MKKIVMALLFCCIASTAHAAKYTTTLDDNETNCFAPVAINGKNNYMGTVKIFGTFGSGTVSIKHSDSSTLTNAVVVDDMTGTDLTFTSEGTVNIELGGYKASGPHPYLCATMTGATNPNVTVLIYDNN